MIFTLINAIFKGSGVVTAVDDVLSLTLSTNKNEKKKKWILNARSDVDVDLYLHGVSLCGPDNCQNSPSLHNFSSSSKVELWVDWSAIFWISWKSISRVDEQVLMFKIESTT